MAKYSRMMAPDSCDFIKVVNDVEQKDQGNYQLLIILNAVICINLRMDRLVYWN